MSPEKQTAAILDACPGLFWVEEDSGQVYWNRDGVDYQIELLNDLNAIQAAVLAQPERVQHIFETYLYRMISRKAEVGEDYEVYVWRLTAADWCECLLRALGKWEKGE